MGVKTIQTKKLSWHFISDFSSSDLSFLKKNFRFHPLDLKDCAGEVQRTKLDVYKNYFFLVVQLPEYNQESGKVSVTQFYVFVGKDYVVTVMRDKFKPLSNLFYKIANNTKMRDEVFSTGSGYLLYRMLEVATRQQWKTIDRLDQNVKRIEYDIDNGKGKKAVYEVASLRRVILELKSVVSPLRIVINSLTRLNVSFITEDMQVYFDDIDDYVEKIWFSVESYQDRMLSLHDINESLISYRTNRIIALLTIFSVALMPLTLLSGIYGMNIDLPFAHNTEFIWMLFGTLLFLDILIYFILRKNDWI